MAYSYREVPESEREVEMLEVERLTLSYPDSPLSSIEHRVVTPYEILDEQGEQITIVYAEVDAEALISHLNR